MPHEININITIGHDGERCRAKATFENEEWDSFLRYIDHAKELAAIKLVRNGGPGQLKLNYEKGTGISFTTDLPPDEQIIALLHRLRPFILKDEVTNFLKVCNHLKRRIDNDEFRKFLKSMKDVYLGKAMQEMVKIYSNNELINSEKTLTTWLNAHEYHKDVDKQAELELLHKILPLETSRAIFVMMIFEKVKAIFTVNNLLKVVVDEEECFKFPVK